MPTDTHTQLLDAAEALFSERGYKAVGIREIVDRAAANISAIKYHFGSKQGLYLAVIRRAMQRPEARAAWDAFDPPPESSADAAVAIAIFQRLFLHHCVRLERDHSPSLICREAAEPSEALDEILQLYIRPHMAALTHAVGILQPSADDSQRVALGNAVLSLVLHYKTFYAFHARLGMGEQPSDEVIDAIAEELSSFSLRGLGCDEAAISGALKAVRQHVPLGSDS
ncbi:MAG: CerR family C-terminal domain-containing protein [Planctomycetota bacterium]